MPSTHSQLLAEVENLYGAHLNDTEYREFACCVRAGFDEPERILDEILKAGAFDNMHRA